MMRIAFFHTERGVVAGNELLLTSHNLVDFYLYVSNKINDSILYCPLLTDSSLKRVALEIPDNTAIKTVPFPEPNKSVLLNFVSIIRFFGYFFTKNTWQELSAADASVSAALEFGGTYFGLVRSLVLNKRHAFLVRGNRLVTLKRSNRNVVSKALARFRVWIYFKLMLYLVGRKDVQIWFQGQEYYEYVKKRLRKNCHSKLHLLNAVLRDTSVQESRDQTECVYDLVYTGRITSEKGIADLIQAISIIKRDGRNLKTLFLGVGPYLHKAKSLVSRLKLDDEVVFAGYVSDYSDLVRYLRQSRLFVLPSYTEGLPRSMLESMSAGIPVLVSSVGGIPYVIKDQCNGFLVKPAQPQELARKIVSILDMEADRLSEIVDKAMNDSRNFTFENRAREFVSVLADNRHADETLC